MAVALPVEVGDRFTSPDLPRRKSCFLPSQVGLGFRFQVLVLGVRV
jgi:hypothetical protein